MILFHRRQSNFEKARRPGHRLGKAVAPQGWTGEQISKLIALVPVCGRRWALIGEVIGISNAWKIRAQYEQAEGKRLLRCQEHQLAYTSEILPVDFGPDPRPYDVFAHIRKAAFEAVADINRRANAEGWSRGPPKTEWSKYELMKLMAVTPICGDKWKIIGEVVHTRSPQDCKIQVEKAEERRAARCPNQDSPNPFILDDFMDVQGTDE